ncbi:hypothetical protein Slala03_66600 [Streptomyces lavendulae subsp. lavendulae]|uniref:GAP family protein n=1 Tax=Streptomyces lavendulae TaxID=1914 RepID=UPI0024A20557|nr:GAP family protein [Streptomyces lavendulae]GLV86971.1 hypothetical protein Slala03_66600 [Streptomyces lavendulae subsp. lavendulae]
MLGQAMGALLPAALAVALSPFPLIAIVLILSGAHGRRNGPLFAAGWITGLAIVVLGVRKWWKRPRAGERTEPPRWMASLDGATAGRALLLGVLLSGANPKNLVLTTSATASVVEAGAHDVGLVAAVAVYVLIASCTVLGAVGIHLAGGERAASFLEGVRRFMVANSTVITVIVLLLLGASVLGDGLSGLGR